MIGCQLCAWFGYSVAVSGDAALVGAFELNGAGSAYVFSRSGMTWTEDAKLTASDATAFDVFGCAVALSGTTAIVGAFDTDLSKGSAYVFLFDDKLDLGEACTDNAECFSGFCADGVCCNTACGGASDQCQACSVAAGAAVDGTCTSGCNDANECTTDSCDAATGCAQNAVADGTPCNGGECQSGVCTSQGGGGAGGEGGLGGEAAGAGGSGAGDSGTGGSGTGGSGTGDESDGCSCRVIGAPVENRAPHELAWIALATLVAARMRRRRAA